jgi:acyl-CoA thioesterase
MSSAFQRETTVVADPDVPGRHHAQLSMEWAAPNVPQGGISLATAVRAMQAELASDDMPLRSVSCVFAAPVEAGDAEIDVTVLRRGRSVAQVAATVRTPGRAAGLTAIAVFGASRPGFEFTDLTIPEFPDPASLPSFRDPLPANVEIGPEFPIWANHIEGRPIVGHPPWEDYEPTTSERQTYHRFDEPPRLHDGTVDPLSLVCLCDTMPGAVGERMGPDHVPWYGPSADLTVHITGVARSEWILMRNWARCAGDGYASVEIELWDPETGLVAYGTQTMIFTFAEGPPEGEARFPADVRRRRAAERERAEA